jgi:hypothetical protein
LIGVIRGKIGGPLIVPARRNQPSTGAPNLNLQGDTDTCRQQQAKTNIGSSTAG